MVKRKQRRTQFELDGGADIAWINKRERRLFIDEFKRLGGMITDSDHDVLMYLLENTLCSFYKGIYDEEYRIPYLRD